MSLQTASSRARDLSLRAIPFLTAFSAALSVSLLMAACAGAERATVPAASTPIVIPLVGSDVTLAIGEAVRVNANGIQLTFTKVTSDSRCPTSVQCVWAGSARIALRVTGPTEQREVAVETATPRDTVSIDRYLVRLVRVEPAPVTTDAIPSASYRATLQISSK